MSVIMENAQVVEEMVNRDFGYDLGKAMLFAINEVDEDNSVTMTLAGEHGDVYDLLDSEDSHLVAKVSDYVAVVTCGWASPLQDTDDDEIAPSQHPQRRRVRLVVMANKEGVASVLRFQDDTETVTDEGQATGSLADAIKALFA